ncbi:PEP/pyruvate-binding domain-containing protein [Kitasatospora griseola]|uniref:PEP/pyruvate-binding domain-containing protein n=1 Tax=Kitasatospora griseola TaxID=2064 RepID=UPI0037F83558
MVGGKNASLGELANRLTAAGVRVPAGFATAADAFREFLDTGGLRQRIEEQLGRLEQDGTLPEVGAAVRAALLAAPLPAHLETELADAYRHLAAMAGREDPDVAVRSSATAEDSPEAGFAGQQETFLNVRGVPALLDACRRCFASLFTDRAIDYRQRLGLDQLAVALSVGVQLMVRSDLGSAGVAFTLADRVLAEMAANGLERGRGGLKVYVMAEIPSNIVLTEKFAERFDGFSIGGNDLTQLTLGVDRDSDLLAHLFDESDPAVIRSIERLVTAAHAAGRPVGLCGQRPGNDPEFTRFLVRCGLDSVSVAPDSFAAVKQCVADAEGGS